MGKLVEGPDYRSKGARVCVRVCEMDHNHQIHIYITRGNIKLILKTLNTQTTPKISPGGVA